MSLLLKLSFLICSAAFVAAEMSTNLGMQADESSDDLCLQERGEICELNAALDLLQTTLNAQAKKTEIYQKIINDCQACRDSPSSGDISCPKYFVHLKNGCYYVSKLKSSHSQADAQCRSLNSTLLRIETNEESDSVNAYLYKLDINDYWTDGRRVDTQNKFVWGDGSPTAFENWAEGQPQGSLSTDKCIKLFKRGNLLKWQVKNCDEKYGFVCEFHH